MSAVTNAFWAATRHQALTVLSSLPEIQVLSVSTDEYHQRAIPIDNIRNVTWAAKATGQIYNIAVCTDDEEKPEFKNTMRSLEEMGELQNTRVTMTFPGGRAKKNEHKFTFDYSPTLTESACGVASAPVIYPNGRIMACIGPLLTLPPIHPLALGNLREEPLDAILDRAETNAILHTIRVWGPHKLASLLAEYGHSSVLPRQYIRDCACDGCCKLLSDASIVALLEEIFEKREVQELVAYGRFFYLGESVMAERLHLQKDSVPLPG